MINLHISFANSLFISSFNKGLVNTKFDQALPYLPLQCGTKSWVNISANSLHNAQTFLLYTITPSYIANNNWKVSLQCQGSLRLLMVPTTQLVLLCSLCSELSVICSITFCSSSITQLNNNYIFAVQLRTLQEAWKYGRPWSGTFVVKCCLHQLCRCWTAELFGTLMNTEVPWIWMFFWKILFM